MRLLCALCIFFYCKSDRRRSEAATEGASNCVWPAKRSEAPPAASDFRQQSGRLRPRRQARSERGRGGAKRSVPREGVAPPSGQRAISERRGGGQGGGDRGQHTINTTAGAAHHQTDLQGLFSAAASGASARCASGASPYSRSPSVVEGGSAFEETRKRRTTASAVSQGAERSGAPQG